MTDPDAVIEIRQASVADAETLASIGAETFAAAYQATTTPEDIAAHIDANFSPAAMHDALQKTSCDHFLAIVDATPAGLLKLRRNEVPEQVPVRDAIEIQLLYVLPAFQRYGLGARLVAAARRIAQEEGARGIWLSAWEEADWAIAFYTKVGFRQVGKQAFKVGETHFTDFIMWLSLD